MVEKAGQKKKKKKVVSRLTNGVAKSLWLKVYKVAENQ